MDKKEFGILMFIVSMIFFGIGFRTLVTGNLILGSGGSNFSILNIIGLIFLIGSFLLLISKKSLDLLIIPTGESEQNPKRTKKAIEEWGKKHYDKIMISGIKKGEIKNTQRYFIYDLLRKEGIKPKDIYVSGGKDSEGNIKSTFKKLGKLGKEVKSMGIVSYPSHLDRFEDYINEEKDKGNLPRNLKLHKIPTRQTFKETIYGSLAKIKDKYPVFEKINGGPVGKLLKNIFGG